MIITMSELPKLYWLLATLRILSVLIPQFGYIHPDEYFQSIEILAGKAFELETNPPWEFNTTSPIRSITLSYFTIGQSYKILNILNTFSNRYQFLPRVSFINTYSLIVAPRLLLTLLSFLVDFSLYKICVNNNEKYRTKLLILASSYVTLTYATRTLSNSLESILFALLLYYVAESVIFSNDVLKKREYLNYRCETSKTLVEKVKFHKLKLYLRSDHVRNCIEISSITVFGFFNRPTFLLFALFPIFFWLYRGIGNKLILPLTFHLRIVILLLCAVPTILFHVLVDSFFYGYISWGEIGVFDVSINNFVFTPWNFIKYNINQNNLAKHGLHPRYLHALVNLPLLFNILALFAIYGFLHYFYNFSKGKNQLLPSIRSMKGLMATAYLAPLALLSFFPHQEPRFIIPLILPLVYLFGSCILPESDTILSKLNNRNVGKHSTNENRSNSNILIRFWLIVNGLLFIFYGFLHQGGIYSTIDYLSKEMRVNPLSTEYHLVTSHIYSIPESLLLQKSTNKLYFAKGTRYSVDKRVFLYETGSLDLFELIETIKRIKTMIQTEKRAIKPNKKFKLMLIISGSLEGRLNYILENLGLDFQLKKTFYPHLSTEAFPDLAHDLIDFYSDFSFDNIKLYLYHFITSFSLQLYEIYV